VREEVIMVARLAMPSWEYKYPRRGVFENPVVWPILYARDSTTRLIEVVDVAGRWAQRWVWVNVVQCGDWVWRSTSMGQVVLWHALILL
jgi:hypothetical protein